MVWDSVNFTYDENDNPISEIHCTSQNTKTIECDVFWSYEYDSLDNLISEKYTRQFEVVRHNSMAYKYVDSIIVEKEIKEYHRGRIMSHRIEHYENELVIFTEDLIRESTIVHKYNDDKTIKTVTRNFGNGETITYNHYLYDEHNNPILIVHYDESGYGQIEIMSYEYF